MDLLASGFSMGFGGLVSGFTWIFSFFFFLVDSHCSLCEANFPGKIFCVFMILVVWLKNGLFKV